MAACYLLIYTGMGIAAGPNVPRDGLALWYDFSTTRSFRGEPTTNLVNPSWSSWGVDGSGFANVGTRTILNAYHCRITDSNTNTRQNIYIEGVSANTVYTFSVQYQRISGTPTLRFQILAYNSGTYLSMMSFATTSQLGVTDSAGWQTASITLTTPANTNKILWYMQDGDDYTGYTHTFEIRNVQMEQKSYATTFVDGTRGTTVAAGGGVIDLSGRANSGELVNGVTASSLFGGIVSFDGTNDYLDTTLDLSWNNTNSATIMMFVKPSSLTSYYPFIGKGPYDWEWQLMQKNTSLQFIYWNTGGGHTNGPIPEITNFFNSVDEFVHVAMVWNHVDNKYYFYRNGVLVNTTTWVDASINQNRANNIRIGGNIYIWQTSGYFWPGSVGEVKAYNTALTAAQVDQSYRASEARFAVKPNPIVSSGLVLHLDAANRDSYRGSGTTWTDLSGYGNNGTLTNGPTFKTGNGGHLLFDGVNDYVDIGNQSTMSFTNGIFTVEALIYVSRTWTSGSQYPNLLSKGATAGWDTDGWSLFVFRDWPNAGQYSWGVGLRNNSPTPTTNIVARYAFAPDTYLHICAVLSGSGTTVILYENGSQVNTGSQTINPASNSTSVLIARDNNGTSYPGRVAFARAYGRALTAAEVLQNYNATRGRFGL